MEVFWSEKLKVPNRAEFCNFLNMMSKRIAQGHARYGPPKADKMYIKRLKMELKEYTKTGNLEHLVNCSNYCWLESVAPSNPRFHHDSTVDSVTRGKV